MWRQKVKVLWNYDKSKKILYGTNDVLSDALIYIFNIINKRKNM